MIFPFYLPHSKLPKRHKKFTPIKLKWNIQFNENATINHYSPRPTLLKSQISLFCNKIDSHKRIAFPDMKLLLCHAYSSVVLLMLNVWSHFYCLLYWNNFSKIHSYSSVPNNRTPRLLIFGKFSNPSNFIPLPPYYWLQRF